MPDTDQSIDITVLGLHTFGEKFNLKKKTFCDVQYSIAIWINTFEILIRINSIRLIWVFL